ncbi:MAG TPA: BrnT family toxin [Lichenihabitans sp.]|jgi:hypothetical protein|nr:BrnT family toxin [Lichenihabitans sp.]
MDFGVAGFEWDEGNRAKCCKHGLSLSEIETVFSGRPRIAPDLKHGRVEQRFVAIGPTSEGRLAFVVFTWRGALIRPLSTRYMHAKEIKRYETESS